MSNDTTLSEVDLEVEYKEERQSKKISPKKQRAQDRDMEIKSNLDPRPEPAGEVWLETESDEYGPIADGLKDLIDWIDKVDPLTGEVTRVPILPEASQEETVGQPANVDSVNSASVDKTAHDSQEEETKEKETEVSQGQINQDPVVEPGNNMGETNLENINEQNVLAEFVDFLLSDDGKDLRQQTRSAAYEVRKAAYEQAVLEIQPMIEEARARQAQLLSHSNNTHLSTSDYDLLAAAKNAFNAVKKQAEEGNKEFQRTQAIYEQASSRLRQAITLLELGKAPAFLVQNLESSQQEAASEMLAAWAKIDRAQAELQMEGQALKEVEEALKGSVRELEEHKEQERQEISVEIVNLEKRRKERQEEIASRSPEVILWKVVQAERNRREAEVISKLIAQLPSQGIRKTLEEARHVGVAQHPHLIQAIQGRQKRVDRLIDACREQAERLSAFPEVLPDDSYALLVRGDAIRVVDGAGHELAVMYSNDDGSEFQTVRRSGVRRWKVDPSRDCWLVKR